MANYHFMNPADQLQSLRPPPTTTSSSLSLCEFDQNMDILMSPFPDFNPGGMITRAMESTSNTCFNMQQMMISGTASPLMGFPQDIYFNQEAAALLHDQQFPGGGILPDSFIFPAGEFRHAGGDLSSITEPNCSYEKKRKSMPSTPAESTSANSSPPVSETGSTRKNSTTGRGKRVKTSDQKDEEKSKEVVHVRAKRGQATDSHSLAERVRRGKINERLRCLQDIVPGCQKTMGMAVMLDEIINYVQSLQNQVEFLSMKLTAASNMYSFNGETDTIDIIQRAKAFEAMKMQKLMKEERRDGGVASTQLGHFDQSFGGYYPPLPYNNTS